MLLWKLLDAAILISLAACIIVWPTQLISDNQNRWLRSVAIALVVIQLLIDGPRVRLFGAYLVAALFALLLVSRKRTDNEPSAIRESKESPVKKVARWAMVLGTATVLLAAVLYDLWYRA